jgi:hypothetical protein
VLAGFGEGEAPLELQPLGGGFSGAQVFVARLQSGRAAVLKVGPREEVARERFGNESIGRVLGDVVPRLVAWREGARLAAMEMELARSDEPGAGTPATFKAVYEAAAAPAGDELLCNTLSEVLDRALGRLYRWGEKDNADLLEAYGFNDGRGRPQFAASVVARAEAIARDNGFESARVLLDDAGLPGPQLEPKAFYEEWLPGRSLTREVYPSAVHGDLNLANILLSQRPGADRPARVWIIDFARLQRLPCLTDFAKVENDLAYILFPVGDAEQLRGARALQQARLAGRTLLPELLPLARTPEERRHARLVLELRRIAARMDPRGEAAMDDYRVALLRYAAHTLGFEQPSLLQRRLALEACAQLAGSLAAAAGSPTLSR